MRVGRVQGTGVERMVVTIAVVGGSSGPPHPRLQRSSSPIKVGMGMGDGDGKEAKVKGVGGDAAKMSGRRVSRYMVSVAGDISSGYDSRRDNVLRGY